MATWKQIISEQDKISKLADVHADGDASGQLLIYNNDQDRYEPARLTEGTYSSITHADAAVTIEISNQNGLDRLANLTGSEILIGHTDQTSNAGRKTIMRGDVDLDTGNLTTTIGKPLTMKPRTPVGTNVAGQTTNIYGGASTGNAVPGRLNIGVSNQSGTSSGTENSLLDLINLIGNATGGSITIDAGEVLFQGTASGVKLRSDVNTTLDSIDWDLDDNSATALSFDTAGKAGLLVFDTQTDAEKVTMSGDLDVAGTATIADLTVTGTTTTINTTNLDVQDAVIKIANVASPTVDTADGAGIEVEHTSTVANYPSIKWTKAQGGGNGDGSGAADGLTGWGLKNARTSNAASSPIAIMDFKSDAGAPNGNSQGPGSFCYNTNDDALYIRVY